MERTFLLLLSGSLAATLSAQTTYRVTHAFGDSPDGAYPQENDLVCDEDTIFGTTPFGGSWSNGVMFSINLNGTGYTVLKSFDGDHDGTAPEGQLVSSNGSLFGTTIEGGAFGDGTLYRMATNGLDFAVITNFSDGQPWTGLVSDRENLYGIVSADGRYWDLFAINPGNSNYSIIAYFDDSEASWPSRLILEGSTLYGTGSSGGAAGFGSVFKVNADGTGFAVLRTFTNSPDGAYPGGALVLSGDTLYGVTAQGGAFDGGTIFKVNTNGSNYEVLKNFQNTEGSVPTAGLILNGTTLFGTTHYGGEATNTSAFTGCGTVFKMNTDGTRYTVLKAFSAMSDGVNTDGAYPDTGLLLVGKTLYGATSGGGANGKGVVFSLTLAPEIKVEFATLDGKTNQIGFSVAGLSNQVVVIEATTNLTNTNWIPLQTNVLGSGWMHFSDEDWTNYSGRFYRAVSP